MRRKALLVAVLWVGMLLPTPHVSAQNADPVGQSWSETEVARAIEAVKADPNLATERKISTLAWRRSDTPPAEPFALFQWLSNLVGWLNQTTRALLWVSVALLAGLLAIVMYRLIRARYQSPEVSSSLSTITHVHDLDIRPESLPKDIGGAARQLWDSGEPRAALSLLYRGLLSRLVHVHQVPIRDSSTEGDCLALSAAHVRADRQAYVSELIAVWERAVYGHTLAPTARVHALCGQFAAALDARHEAQS